jgi:hypothetical protein
MSLPTTRRPNSTGRPRRVTDAMAVLALSLLVCFSRDPHGPFLLRPTRLRAEDIAPRPTLLKRLQDANPEEPSIV